MANWRRVLTVDEESSQSGNQFVTINADESIEVVRINDLDSITPDAGSDIPSTIANNPDNYLFCVDEVDVNEHKKLTLEHIVSAIAVELVGGMSSETRAYFTGATSGLPADLNDDGAVSVADLLELLVDFGLTGTREDSSVRITTTASQPIQPTAVYTNDADPFSSLEQIEFTQTDVVGAVDNVAVTVDAANDKIIFQNAETGPESNWFSTHQGCYLQVVGGAETNSFSFTTTVDDATVYVFMKAEAFAGSTSQEVHYSILGTGLTNFGAGDYTFNTTTFETNSPLNTDGDTTKIEVSFFAGTATGEFVSSFSIEDLTIKMFRS